MQFVLTKNLHLGKKILFAVPTNISIYNAKSCLLDFSPLSIEHEL